MDFPKKKRDFNGKSWGFFGWAFLWGFDWERIGWLMGIEWDMNEIE